MFKIVFLMLILVGAVLYFTGTLEFDTSGDKVNISIDKDKIEEFGKSIKEKVEE